MCGDYISRRFLLFQEQGSPPRVRGLLFRSLKSSVFDGITPACAGTTPGNLLLSALHWDHPRVCGDYVHDGGETSKWRGSPPRVRGLLNGLQPPAVITGITPACAGTTSSFRRC